MANRGGGGSGAGRAGRAGVGDDQALAARLARVNLSTSDLAQDVNILENTIARAIRYRYPPTSTIEKAELPHRAGYRTADEQLRNLEANYFELPIGKGVVLYRYNVVFEEGKTAPKGGKLKSVIEVLLQNHFSAQQHLITSDFKEQLICKDSVEIDEDKIYSVRPRTVTTDQPEVNEEGTDPADSGPYNERSPFYRIKLKYIRAFNMSELTNHLSSPDADNILEDKVEFVQALDIVLGHQPKLSSQIASIGANKHFDLSEKLDIGNGLHVLRGLFVSVRPATARMLVNVQIKHSVFYNPDNLDKLIQDSGIPEMVELERFIIGLRVKVPRCEIKGGVSTATTPKIRTIAGLADPNDGAEGPRPRVSKKGAGPNEISFYDVGKRRYVRVGDYFVEKYGRRPSNDFPVVNVGSVQRPVYVPATECEVLPGQPYRGKVNPQQTELMIKHAVRKPDVNRKYLWDNAGEILGLGSPVIKDLLEEQWRNEFIAVTSRILPTPTVVYDRNTAVTPFRGSWYMTKRSGKIDTPLRFRAVKPNGPTWQCVYFSWRVADATWARERGLAAGIRSFTQTLNSHGVRLGTMLAPKCLALAPNNSMQMVQNCIRAAAADNVRFLLVILPTDESALYNVVKKACDITHGITNVCMTRKKFLASGFANFRNVAMKVNLKLGGTNHQLNVSPLDIFGKLYEKEQNQTMIVGLDVTHPGPGVKNDAPSIAGIVASVDGDLAQWPGETCRQNTANKEMVDSLTGMFDRRLRLWQRNPKNKDELPRNVIIYRDGVPEGQYQTVLDEELVQIKSACARVYGVGTEQPRITIVVVGKRHNTRFYEKTTRAEGHDNPQPGTVVDRTVTEARNWDFFLQAHGALQGTARPTHYYVIYDEVFRGRNLARPPAEALQELTHNMCYLFGRATKAVSVCPPAYYADLICDRARRYISRVYEGAQVPLAQQVMAVHRDLRDTMFYI